jgi:hypothetical protein
MDGLQHPLITPSAILVVEVHPRGVDAILHAENAVQYFLVPVYVLYCPGLTRDHRPVFVHGVAGVPYKLVAVLVQ